MSEISAAKVKELRTKTGAGMMDCKKALQEVGGDMEQAIEWLRKKGISKASKKADRVAAEGLVGSFVEGNKGAVIELNSETDFVAKNEEFQNFLREIGSVSLGKSDLAAVTSETLSSTGKSVEDSLKDLIAKIGENMNLRRFQSVEVANGTVVAYTHNAVTASLGKIGVLVALEGDVSSLSEDAQASVQILGKQIAMHIAAVNPLSVSVDSLDPATVDKEREILKEQALASGKPENIVDKMVEGRIKKFYQENVLLEQEFVIDGETPIKQVVANLSKEVGTNIEIKEFVRFGLGEGVEKEEKDFAAEVAEQLKAG